MCLVISLVFVDVFGDFDGFDVFDDSLSMINVLYFLDDLGRFLMISG